MITKKFTHQQYSSDNAFSKKVKKIHPIVLYNGTVLATNLWWRSIIVPHLQLKKKINTETKSSKNTLGRVPNRPGEKKGRFWRIPKQPKWKC